MLDRKAFDSMLQSAEPDKTIATLFEQEKKDNTKDLHNTLMLAGFTPAYGNVADAADALLYATEGEFGEAALSGASAIPIIGQFVASKRALKAAKEAGEETMTLYRGIADWYPGKMVKDGKFIGGKMARGDIDTRGERWTSSLYTTPNKDYATDYAKRSDWLETGDIASGKYKGKKNFVLEFEVPKKWIEKNWDMKAPTSFDPLNKKKSLLKNEKMWKWMKNKLLNPTTDSTYEIGFPEGLPREFLKKVHK